MLKIQIYRTEKVIFFEKIFLIFGITWYTFPNYE